MLESAGGISRTKRLLIVMFFILFIISPLAVHASALFPAKSSDTSLKLMVGSDYQTALHEGYVSATQLQAGNEFSITIYGIPGATLVIDDLFIIKNQSSVNNIEAGVLSGVSGTLRVTTLELRFYTGSTPPVSDISPGVVGVLYIVKNGTAVPPGSSVQMPQAFNSSNNVIHIQLIFLPSSQSIKGETMQTQVDILAD